MPLRSLILAAALAALPGCDGLIVPAIVEAPNHGEAIDPKEDPKPERLKKRGIDRQFRVAVGPPPASLRVWVMNPKPPEKPNSQASGNGTDGKENNGEAGAASPRGTILIVHGWRNTAAGVLRFGEAMTEAGYRAVLVDLRGHGRSSGQWITYGVRESRDLRQVLDAVEDEGLLARPLGAWGISMGATTAIKLAARDQRIEALVAVAPYTTMRRVVPDFVSALLPVAGWLIPRSHIEQMVDHAGERAGFPPGEADALTAMRRLEIPVLILHGGWDAIVPPEHGRALHQARPENTEFRKVALTGHLGAHFDPARKVRDASVEWLNANLAPQKSAKAHKKERRQNGNGAGSDGEPRP